ncbi:thylakoid-anchored PsbP-like protein [Dunaliella salina]|uniref:Thylakoid-anchored PsbP-like protein n=1 Tax=Dunaliella salina TaxID=3046 RepID=A0ABQ7HAQ3_DUNSA|nr:thylakoid-anchored PsbP-like protein [Dunaliella salina]|eukprot:KAF5843935.1 thylakoid-anchored PsbP-like protein [Dunaliella salina]
MIASNTSARFQLNSGATQAPTACSLPSSHRTHRRIHACRAQGGEGQGPQTEQTGSASKPSLTDPAQTVVWGGNLPNTRRLAISGITATAVALGGNLGGITSFLLGLDDGRTARKLQLDALFPVNAEPTPYKRCIDGTYGYEFTYPAQWLADQTVAYRAAQRAEEARNGGVMGLGDLPPVERSSASLQRARAEQRRRASALLPVAAYGPPGSTGEENVSVIVAPIDGGFDLGAMGTPDTVAEQFLGMIAPPGGSVQAELLGASSREEDGQLYYMMEYRVQRTGDGPERAGGNYFFRHNVSVITSRSNQLYTLNAQVAESQWEQEAPLLRAAANSFRLTSGKLDTTGFPQRISVVPE